MGLWIAETLFRVLEVETMCISGTTIENWTGPSFVNKNVGYPVDCTTIFGVPHCLQDTAKLRRGAIYLYDASHALLILLQHVIQWINEHCHYESLVSVLHVFQDSTLHFKEEKMDLINWKTFKEQESLLLFQICFFVNWLNSESFHIFERWLTEKMVQAPQTSVISMKILVSWVDNLTNENMTCIWVKLIAFNCLLVGRWFLLRMLCWTNCMSAFRRCSLPQECHCLHPSPWCRCRLQEVDLLRLRRESIIKIEVVHDKIGWLSRPETESKVVHSADVIMRRPLDRNLPRGKLTWLRQRV